MSMNMNDAVLCLTPVTTNIVSCYLRRRNSKNVTTIQISDVPRHHRGNDSA